MTIADITWSHIESLPITLYRAAKHPTSAQISLEALCQPRKHLVSPQELAAKNFAHFPNESAEYRAARNALLAEEIELRRAVERLASQRRALPPGGEVPPRCSFFRGNRPCPVLRSLRQQETR